MIFKHDIDDDRTVGRLGNKLFILAAMASYARQHSQPFAVGPWKYQSSFPRIPIWDPPHLECPVFSETDPFTYQPIPEIPRSGIISLQGYFQSWKYFEQFREDVLFFLTPSNSILSEAHSIMNEWKKDARNLCSIHIRRGDYLNEEIRRVHGLRPLTYYRTAMQIVNPDRFVVFSDDIEWCKEAFGDNPKIIYSQGHSEVLDLFLMSLCDSNIITNSSFSWMAAWLGTQPRTVIAPKQWMASRHVNLQDLLPPDWIAIDDDVETQTSLPLVSIIIPCYKQAHLLQDSVESAAQQDYPNLEIMIINDGSPDNTSEVAQLMIQKYPNRDIKLIEKLNGGLSSARNLGVQNAKGAWILPLDSDDKIESYAVSRFVEEALRTGADIIYCDRQDFGASNYRIQPGVFALDRIIYNNQISYCSLYKRAIWEKVGGYDERMRSYEDWNFWIGAAKHGFSGAYLPLPLFQYRTAENSMYTDAIKHHQQIFCQMVLNHNELYPTELVQKAKQYIDLVGLYGEKKK